MVFVAPNSNPYKTCRYTSTGMDVCTHTHAHANNKGTE